MKISIYDILNSANASLHTDGIQLFNAIQKSFDINKNEQVEVDLKKWADKLSTHLVINCF